MRTIGRILGWILVAALSMAAEPLDRPVPDLIGVRAVGLGGAFVAIASGADGFPHNPAGLGVGRGVTLFAQQNPIERETIRFDPKGIAYGWRGTGLGWTNRFATVDDRILDYTYVGIARRLSSQVAIGLNAKFWRTHPTRHFQVFGNSPTFDLGVLVAPRADLRVGLRIGGTDRGDPLAEGAIGLARRIRAGLVAVEVGRRPDGDWALRAGIEHRMSRAFSLRIGWRDGAPSAGIGFRRRGMRLQTAWTRYRKRNLVFVGMTIEAAVRDDWTR